MQKQTLRENILCNALVSIAIFLVVGLVTLAVFSCGSKAKTENEEEITLTFIERGVNYQVYRHEETGIYYLFGNKGICVMLNADGTPYTGEQH